MKKLTIVYGNYYSSAASYLMNRDDTGITEEERHQADAFLQKVSEIHGITNPSVVDCYEYGFDKPDYVDGLKGDMLTYTITGYVEVPEE